MENKPTNELDSVLENIDMNHIKDYLEENKRYLADEKKEFYYYIKDVLYEKNIMLKDVYAFAGISSGFGSKIISMEKHTKDRDIIIRICVAGHFALNEINRALKLYGMSELYSKNPRDAVIIVAINKRKYNLYDIDEKLKELGLKAIMPKE